jgi:hypothetical protein
MDERVDVLQRQSEARESRGFKPRREAIAS